MLLRSYDVRGNVGIRYRYLVYMITGNTVTFVLQRKGKEIFRKN